MIKAQEEKIRELLKVNEQARKAFDKMLTYYQVYDMLHYTTHIKLIKCIYLDNIDRYVWQMENIANIGHTSCFEYRKKYIRCFYACFL